MTGLTPAEGVGEVTLFLCGDVMTGRGIDQILPHPGEPALYEHHVKSALDYVALAEEANGSILRPVTPDYIWGDALAVLDRMCPDVRIVNLETSVTTSDDWQPKGINYRMSPANVGCLNAAGIDCCALANNHVLDWGHSGLGETLATLRAAGIRTAGAGCDGAEAAHPAVLDVAGKGRVLVYAFGTTDSGIPGGWAASGREPGINLLPDLSRRRAARLAREIAQVRRTGDIVLVSIHWGSNWGYEVPRAHVAFAHRFIDEGGVDIIHGHSSHHPKGIEVYKGKPILYGCGDFLNDYEGIGGREEYRGHLVLMYFATFDSAAGTLRRLTMTPLQIQKFRLNRAAPDDADWLCHVADREVRKFGGQVCRTAVDRLDLRWR